MLKILLAKRVACQRILKLWPRCYALRQRRKINIKTYDTGIERDVALGRADAFIMDRLSALEWIKKWSTTINWQQPCFVTHRKRLAFR